jgi:hypothetical protein
MITEWIIEAMKAEQMIDSMGVINLCGSSTSSVSSGLHNPEMLQIEA